MDQTRADEVLAGWAPAGLGRIVVVLGQGVVIHRAVVSGAAGATGVAQGVASAAGVSGGSVVSGSPFLQKVLRNGVEGLLASPRMTLVLWDRITSAEYRRLRFGRARMTIRTSNGEHTLKFLQNTYIAGDPAAVFARRLGSRFTGAATAWFANSGPAGMSGRPVWLPWSHAPFRSRHHRYRFR
ncbi:hypothetical protein D1871_19065 [Nakamurella silvestris]|nr:hypothetical protein D1871_19065 [Nakamurella silvestris]